MNPKHLTYEQQVKQARKTAVVFGVLAVFALISIVYALVKQVEATAALELAKVERSICERSLAEATEEATRQKEIGDVRRMAAEKEEEKARVLQYELDQCRQRKGK
ncbi:MAG: hypothetical protein SH819_05730 [Cytophagales bacterium]|nr:hypothetical protein [Cytophagales bacterium]